MLKKIRQEMRRELGMKMDERSYCDNCGRWLEPGKELPHMLAGHELAIPYEIEVEAVGGAMAAEVAWRVARIIWA